MATILEIELQDGSVHQLSGGDKHFTFTQSTPSNTWTITHNLGKHPSITVVDSANNVVEGDYEYIDNNNVVLTFSGAFSGKAYLN